MTPPAMLGVNSGFITHHKRLIPDIIINHCMSHREALVSETLPKELQSVLRDVKSSALNTRIFRNLCSEMDSSYQNLLFYTEGYQKGMH